MLPESGNRAGFRVTDLTDSIWNRNDLDCRHRLSRPSSSKVLEAAEKADRDNDVQLTIQVLATLDD